MSSLTHEERVLRMCRSIYVGRDVTLKWAAECCGISTEEFIGYYNQYINRLCHTIQHKHEFFLFSELKFLVLSGYMRPDECARRFLGSDTPENIEKIERWIESQGGIDENLSWQKMRMINVKQKEQEKTDGENQSGSMG